MVDNGFHQSLATSLGPLPSGGPLYCSLKMLKVLLQCSLLLHYMLARPPCSDSCMHHQNPLNNMRKTPLKTWEKAKIYKLLLQNPTSKISPTRFKKDVPYIFQGSYEESQLPSRSSLFLGSNPPSNGLKSSKNPFFGHCYRTVCRKGLGSLSQGFKLA